MSDLTKTLCGMPALFVKALRDTFLSMSGTQTITGTKTFSGTTTLSGTTTISGKLTHGGVVPASATLTPAAGGANICLVTIQLKDAAGTNLATSRNIDVWLSDAATGIGLTGTTASGAVAAGASGTDMFTYTSKKHLKVQTTAAGLYILSITDTAKSGFYVSAQLQGAGNNQVSSQLITGNYG